MSSRPRIKLSPLVVFLALASSFGALARRAARQVMAVQGGLVDLLPHMVISS